MRLSIALVWVPLSAALVIEPRQKSAESAAASRPPPDLTALLSDTEPSKVVVGQPSVQMKDAKNLKLYFGPFNVLPAKEAAKEANPMRTDASGTAFQYIANGFPEGSIVLRTNTTLQYEDGSRADASNGIYDHHVMFLDTSKPSTVPLQCVGTTARNMKPVSKFAGVSADTGPTYFSDHKGNFRSGYHLSNNSKIMMTAELVNQSEEKKVIYIVTELDYIDGSTSDITDTVVSSVSVSECDPQARDFINPPPNKQKFAVESAQMMATMDGYILTRRGHLHNGGKNIILRLNGQTICDSTAVYDKSQQLSGPDGHRIESLSAMGECFEPVRVQRGDAINIEAFYDLDAHPLRPAAYGGELAIMGLMTFAFAQDDTGTAKVNPSSSSALMFAIERSIIGT